MTHGPGPAAVTGAGWYRTAGADDVPWCTTTVTRVPAAPSSFCRIAATKATTATMNEQTDQVIQNLPLGSPSSQ
ncbi:hypothetical protein ACFWBV_18625 [Streptomyces sp. NPDC060030]|uniref:hypothetical protein n=1 Tax=Streptomyces sp. NPDC060030 TaxID=3347042 RepID=UPI00369D460B